MMRPLLRCLQGILTLVSIVFDRMAGYLRGVVSWIEARLAVRRAADAEPWTGPATEAPAAPPPHWLRDVRRLSPSLASAVERRHGLASRHRGGESTPADGWQVLPDRAGPGRVTERPAVPPAAAARPPSTVGPLPAAPQRTGRTLRIMRVPESATREPAGTPAPRTEAPEATPDVVTESPVRAPFGSGTARGANLPAPRAAARSLRLTPRTIHGPTPHRSPPPDRPAAQAPPTPGPAAAAGIKSGVIEELIPGAGTATADARGRSETGSRWPIADGAHAAANGAAAFAPPAASPIRRSPSTVEPSGPRWPDLIEDVPRPPVETVRELLDQRAAHDALAAEQERLPWSA